MHLARAQTQTPTEGLNLCVKKIERRGHGFSLRRRSRSAL